MNNEKKNVKYTSFFFSSPQKSKFFTQFKFLFLDFELLETNKFD